MPAKDERLVVKIPGVITIESVGRMAMWIGLAIILATLTALSVMAFFARSLIFSLALAVYVLA